MPRDEEEGLTADDSYYPSYASSSLPSFVPTTTSAGERTTTYSNRFDTTSGYSKTVLGSEEDTLLLGEYETTTSCYPEELAVSGEEGGGTHHSDQDDWSIDNSGVDCCLQKVEKVQHRRAVRRKERDVRFEAKKAETISSSFSSDRDKRERQLEFEGIDKYLGGGRSPVPKKRKAVGGERLYTTHDLIMGRYYPEDQPGRSDWNNAISWTIKLCAAAMVMVIFVIVAVVIPVITFKNMFVGNNPGFVLLMIFGPTLALYALVIMAQVYEQDRTKMY